jgi:hypothetical protein
MPVEVLVLAAWLQAQGSQLRSSVRSRLGDDPESGASTLEIVIITLGLIAVAGILVAALTAAVQSRTDQIR